MTPGIIAAGRQDTAAAGAAMLEAGGNAVDAAVAAAFASFVAEPSLVSLGGGGYALLHRAGSGRPRVYDFFCAFPGLDGAPPAHLDFKAVYADFGTARQEFHIGRGSVAVPGNAAGLCRLHADAGRLPLATVLEPAIDLAQRGLPLGPFNALVGGILAPIVGDTPEVAALFGAPDHFLDAAHVHRNPDLAATLAALGREGPDLLYRGDIAKRILADQRDQGGLLTAADLASYEVLVREPLHRRYRGFDVFTNSSPSRGGALIAFSLALLEAYGPNAQPPGSARRLRLLAEVMRQTNLARPALEQEGDAQRFLAADFVAVHARELAQRLSKDAGRSESDPPAPRTPNHTSHISVLDGEGTVVSLTTTAGEGAGFVVPGTGIILNNILGEADLHPQGFHRGVPGARIGSMMAPTLVLANDQPVLALGSGGSNRLRTAILQVLLNILDHGLDPPTAVAAPRCHFEEGVLQVEAAPLRPRAVGWLRRWGYEVVSWPDRHMYFGGVHTVGHDHEGLAGAGDPRRSGALVQVRESPG